MRTPEERKQHGAAYYQNNKQECRDWGIQYRALNKDVIRAKKKSYAEANKTKLCARASECLLCDCGKYYTRIHRVRHNKTVFHKENVNLVMFSQFLDH